MSKTIITPVRYFKEGDFKNVFFCFTLTEVVINRILIVLRVIEGNTSVLIPLNGQDVEIYSCEKREDSAMEPLYKELIKKPWFVTSDPETFFDEKEKIENTEYNAYLSISLTKAFLAANTTAFGDICSTNILDGIVENLWN